MKRSCSKTLCPKPFKVNLQGEPYALSLKKTGFTLIELLVVFSIIALFFTIGIAAFNEFNRSQIVVQAAQELKENLRLAQSKALAGEKPDDCATQTLNGWQVRFVSGGSYQLEAVCANPVTFRTISLPGDLRKTSGPGYVLFKVLGQGVEFPGAERTITITGFGDKTAKVTVTTTGEIKIEE